MVTTLAVSRMLRPTRKNVGVIGVALDGVSFACSGFAVAFDIGSGLAFVLVICSGLAFAFVICSGFAFAFVICSGFAFALVICSGFAFAVHVCGLQLRHLQAFEKRRDKPFHQFVASVVVGFAFIAQAFAFERNGAS
jgi:ABC-type uncharacterized transport system permease subunit